MSLFAVTSQLVNEVRKERGISAEFISANNADFTFEINNQREVNTYQGITGNSNSTFDVNEKIVVQSHNGSNRQAK